MKKQRIEYLVKYLNDCTFEYNKGTPIISDEEWDNLYFELVSLEKETSYILDNSPTQIIVYNKVDALSKVKHNHSMLSLDKTKETTEVLNFIGHNNFVIMCKMDGLTCSLTYKDGNLVSAETRGNGIEGEDILHNALIIPSIPNKIPYRDEITIDGEIICTYKDFEDFKEEYKNPRNFAAGSIRLLDAEECSTRKLTFVAWDVITELYSEDKIEYRVDQKLEMLSTFGFVVVPYCHCSGALISSEKVLDVYIEDIKAEAYNNYYPIDGVVFKFSDCGYGRSLGATSHHFKNAIAYKFYDDTYETELLDIEYTMGRTGVLTPVAIFKPIDIDGSTIERASLHNLSIMKELNGGFSRVGDIVHIYKANQIIPQVKMWEPVGEGNHIFVPTVCPVCGGPTKIKIDIDTEVLMCDNPNCEGKLINRLDHFCGIQGLDIKGLSKATLEKLIDWGWVSNYTSLFTLKDYRNEWIKKPGFGVKSVDKVLDAIETARNCELEAFISALGIPLIGTSVSKELVKVFPDWNSFIEAAETDYHFWSIPNFGMEMHSSITKFDYTEAKTIYDNYLVISSVENKEEESEANLEGLNFVITGKVSHFKNRDELKSLIESKGGKVVGSISSKTNYLINNDIESTSSKNISAKNLGIPIISEENFIEMFNF